MDECFSRLLNCTNGTKSRNAPHLLVVSDLYPISDYLHLLYFPSQSLSVLASYQRKNEKSWFKLVGLSFSSKLYWVTHIISLVVTASRNIGALIISLKFFSFKFAPSFYKALSTFPLNPIIRS